MATKVNFYENYGDKSARERAELIYSNYSSFQRIIEDCKMRLIYEIKAEKESVAIIKMNLESVFRIWVTTVILQRMKRFLM